MARPTRVGRAIPTGIACQVRRLDCVSRRTFYRTTVLVSLDEADLPSDSYQLFERCAGVLSTISNVFA